MLSRSSLLCAASLLISAQTNYAQQSLFGRNLIINGDAESGPAGTIAVVAANIPGWAAASGKVNVLPYTIANALLLTDPAPPDHGFQYFAGVKSTSSITQDIDVSSAASAIGGGNVRYTLSAYLGSASGRGFATPAQVEAAFKNASGQTFSTATLGPLGYNGNGISLQQQIGLLPVGTVRITLTLIVSEFGNLGGAGVGAADNLSLVLNPSSPPNVIGRNLIVNGDAESGPSRPYTLTALYIPGWSTANGASVAPYGGAGFISSANPGPADRGVNLFHGPGTMYQDLDVSSASTLIDSGVVTYQVSAWLGSLATGTGPTLTYTFFDWSGTQLATTAQLVPARHPGPALVDESHSDILPKGTRRVHIVVSLFGELADDIAFTLSAPAGPPVLSSVISAGAFGGFTSIAPGSWIEIYGINLTSSAPLGWSGSDFSNGVGPTKLGDVTVSVGGQAAYIDYVSPSQVNALVPSNAPVGSPIAITLTNANGSSDPFNVYVNQTEPGLLAPNSLAVGGKQYVGALLSDGSFALPAGAIQGVASRPAKVGETLLIYGVGFGDVTPEITAGTIVTTQNHLTRSLEVLFGTTPATLLYYGLAPSFTGLYQLNVVVPKIANNNLTPISFNLGGVKGAQTLYVAVTN